MSRAQDDVVKILKSMGGKYDLWQLWNDFIKASALSINILLPNPWQSRIDEFNKIHRKYGEDMADFVKMVQIMGEDITENPKQDFLGELFMQLNLSNSWRGQFFTPYSASELMSRLTYTESNHRSVYDPACGAGVTMIAMANLLAEKGIDYHSETYFVGQDVSELAGLMGYIQLSLLGCAGYIAIGDTLTDPVTAFIPPKSENIWIMPMYYEGIWEIRRWLHRVEALK